MFKKSAEAIQINIFTSPTALFSGNTLKFYENKTAMNIDVTVFEVYLVPPRWLIKSSSGKLSRKANKKRILSASAAQVSVI